MFKTETAGEISTHKGTYYLAKTDAKRDTITVEPIANHINSKITGKY